MSKSSRRPWMSSKYLTNRWPANRIAGSEEVQPDVKCDCSNNDVRYDFAQLSEMKFI